MATKLIAFRISGDLLKKAQSLFGDENIVNETRNLLIEFIEQRSPKSENENNLTPNQTNAEIEDLKKQLTELENQQDVINQQIINRLNDLENKIINATTVNNC